MRIDAERALNIAPMHTLTLHIISLIPEHVRVQEHNLPILFLSKLQLILIFVICVQNAPQETYAQRKTQHFVKFLSRWERIAS